MRKTLFLFILLFSASLSHAGTVTISGTGSGGNATTVHKAVGVSWDGGGSVLTTGTTYWIVMPASATITQMVITALPSGSASVNVSSSTSFNSNPTVICASACPSLSSATSKFDSSLTGWTKTIAKDSFLYFVLNSVSQITQLNVTLEYDQQ